MTKISWDSECNCHIDEGGYFNTKTLEFAVGWDGDDGLISLDKLLSLVQTHFPNVPYSSIGISISQESTIVVFDKTVFDKTGSKGISNDDDSTR